MIELRALLIPLLLLASCSRRSLSTQPRNLPPVLKAAVEVANKQAVDLEYHLDQMTVQADDINSEWNQYLSRGFKLEEDPSLSSKLDHKDYWAIYYGPKARQDGGDLFVFVDKKTGEILTVLRGQ